MAETKTETIVESKTKAAIIGGMVRTSLSVRRLWVAAVVLALAIVSVFVLSTAVIGRYGRYVLHDQAAMSSHRTEVGIVLGAGITKDGKPFRELQSRLDVAADALRKGYVQKLVLSGDNRFKGYDEPTAMMDYLVKERGIDAAKLQPDYAGRSTYESCERAQKIFQIKQTIIFSAGSHLPRAIYLCRHFGIEAYGVASQAEANNAMRREALARVKAMLNVYVHGEPTVLGTPIPQ